MFCMLIITSKPPFRQIGRELSELTILEMKAQVQDQLFNRGPKISIYLWTLSLQQHEGGGSKYLVKKADAIPQ